MTSGKHMAWELDKLEVKSWLWAGLVAQLVGCLPSMPKALGSVPAPQKLGVAGVTVHACNPST